MKRNRVGSWCVALGGLVFLLGPSPTDAQSLNPLEKKDKNVEKPASAKLKEAREKVLEAERDLLARLTELGKARMTVSTLNTKLEESRKLIEAAKRAKDDKQAEELGKEVSRLEGELERAKQSLQSAETRHDQAREKYRVARKNYDLISDQENPGGNGKASSSIDEILDQKEKVDQAALQAALAKRHLETLLRQRTNSRKRVKEIDSTLAQIENLLADSEKNGLDDAQKTRLQNEQKKLESEKEALTKSLLRLDEEIILAEARQRVEEEVAHQERLELDKMTSRIYITLAVFGGAILLLLFVRFTLVRTIRNPDKLYTTKKLLSLAVIALSVVGCFIIIAFRFSNFITLIGLAIAGLTIALQEIIASFAAWILIRTTNCYTNRDWIQLGDEFGEVVDIGLIRTTILQAEPFSPAQAQRGGNLTGGLTMVMNSALFKKPLVNFTHGFPFIWCTLRYTITFESDWQRCRELFQEILDNDDEITTTAREAQSHFNDMAGDYEVEISSTQPVVLTWTAGSGVELTIRFLSHPRHRVAAIDRVNRHVLVDIHEAEAVEFAYSTIRSVGNRADGPLWAAQAESQVE